MKKLISSKWFIFCLGFVSGIALLGFHSFGIGKSSDNIYFKLKNDYCIEDIGYLKSGTLLQVDKGMSEGFTRYILYVNLNAGEEVEKYNAKEKDMVIPYWLNFKDSNCID